MNIEIKNEVLQNRLCIENLGDRLEDMRWIVQIISDKVGLDINKAFMLRHGENKVPLETICQVIDEYKTLRTKKTVLADKYGLTYYQLEDILDFS